jgi:hypothetical protein
MVMRGSEDAVDSEREVGLVVTIHCLDLHGKSTQNTINSVIRLVQVKKIKE